MRILITVFFFITLYSCKMSDRDSSSGNDMTSKDSILIPIDTISETASEAHQIDKGFSVLDSSELALFKVVITDTIDITNLTMDYLFDSLVKLDDEKIKFYFQRDSLIEKIKEYYLEPFYYGYSITKDSLYSVLILYRWGEAAILSDYLFYDSEFTLIDLFSPSIIDNQPSYGLDWKGVFINDSIFRQARIERNEDFDNANIEYYDSSIVEYMINSDRTITEYLLDSKKDTIRDKYKDLDIIE